MLLSLYLFFFFFFNDTATTEIYTLSLHDALPICPPGPGRTGRTPGRYRRSRRPAGRAVRRRSEEHTSELQSLAYLVCRLLLEKKKKNKSKHNQQHDRREQRWRKPGPDVSTHVHRH